MLTLFLRFRDRHAEFDTRTDERCAVMLHVEGTMKKLLTSIAVGTAVALTVTVGTATVATAAAPQSTSSSQSVNPAYTVEEMLYGIVFNRGDVAEDLGIIVELPADMTQADREEYDAVVTTLFDSMLAQDAETLEVARDQMASGDPYQVESALTTYRDSFNTALDAEYPGVRDQGGIVTPMCGLIAVCGAVSVAAIALGAAIAVVTFNVAGGINIIYLENGLWDENSFTGAKRTQLQNGDGSDVPQGLSATDTVRFLTTSLAGK